MSVKNCVTYVMHTRLMASLPVVSQGNLQQSRMTNYR